MLPERLWVREAQKAPEAQWLPSRLQRPMGQVVQQPPLRPEALWLPALLGFLYLRLFQVPLWLLVLLETQRVLHLPPPQGSLKHQWLPWYPVYPRFL